MARVFTTATGTPITELLPAKGGRIASEEVAALRARVKRCGGRRGAGTQPCWRWRRVRHRHQSGNTGYERPQLSTGGLPKAGASWARRDADRPTRAPRARPDGSVRTRPAEFTTPAAPGSYCTSVMSCRHTKRRSQCRRQRRRWAAGGGTDATPLKSPGCREVGSPCPRRSWRRRGRACGVPAATRQGRQA